MATCKQLSLSVIYSTKVEFKMINLFVYLFIYAFFMTYTQNILA
jgi:hypothetical protein